jgi:hypothetical protein
VSGFEFLGYKLGEFPNAEYMGNNGLHIGVHQEINKEHIDYFIKVVEDFLSGHNRLEKPLYSGGVQPQPIGS